MPFEVRYVRLPNSLEVPYVEQGNPSGVPVLLLHGFTDSWRSFELVLQFLPESIHAFALTQRGHGDASRPAAAYRIKDFASDLAAFMDVLDLRRTLIVGHSMGSAVAERFAIDHPERTLGLVLVSSRPSLRDRPGVGALWDSTFSKLADPIDPAFVRDFTAVAETVDPAYVEEMVSESLKAPAHVWKAVFQAGLEEDLSDELAKVRAPTLFVWGDQDGSVSPSHRQALLKAITGSRGIVYPGAGHQLHWERPERFAAELVSFTEGLG